ncbi:MAG: hypothetical protein ACOCWZ_07615 [Spirochaetota bacterium]
MATSQAERERKELVKRLKKGRRLHTKPPKVETPQNVYTRKHKHKTRLREYM